MKKPRQELPLFTEKIYYNRFRKLSYVHIKVGPGGEGWVKKHRWLMEQHLGRKLKSHEYIHHINGDSMDNRLENLQIVSHKIHRKIHQGCTWSRISNHCLECGTTKTPHRSHGLCRTCAARNRYRLVELMGVNTQGRWSSKYDCCIKCQKTSRHHHAKGLCYRCYQQK